MLRPPIRPLLLVLAATTTIAAAAHAADKTSGPTPSVAGVPQVCDRTGFKVDAEITPNAAIPDNDPAGITLATPATTADGSQYAVVMIGLELDHTWIGDLIAKVTYDRACNGPDAADPGVKIMCRPGRATCTGGSGFGYGVASSCLNDLLFSDAAPGPITGAPATVPAGCYRPTGSPGSAGPLSDFAGAQKGGCWSLTISDNAGDDVGRVCRFTVYSLNEHPTATRSSTWGRLKSTYR